MPKEAYDFRPVSPGWVVRITYAEESKVQDHNLVGWLCKPSDVEWLPAIWDGELIAVDARDPEIGVEVIRRG
jgi:hypothetical protein